MFSRLHCSSRRLFHIFLKCHVQNRSQCFSWGPPKAEGHGVIPVSDHPCWCCFAFVTKAWRYCPRSAPGQQEPLCWRLSPGLSLAVLGTSCLHAALGSGQRMGLFAHGPGWIGPFVFFRLFVRLLRSFWILSLPAGYLQSLVAFHYINKFTVYMVAARPGPRSVLCPVYTSGGSWLLFSFSANAN